MSEKDEIAVQLNVIVGGRPYYNPTEGRAVISGMLLSAMQVSAIHNLGFVLVGIEATGGTGSSSTFRATFERRLP